MSVTGKDLIAHGWPQGKVIGLALELAEKWDNYNDKGTVLNELDFVLTKPEDYLDDEWTAPTAKELILLRAKPKNTNPMREEPGPYSMWGAHMIEQGALEQMNVAMQLPISVAGALMPDAHHGYGLPVGGVLATENTVIPYAVGVDIACRMRLSIFAQSAIVIGQRRAELAEILLRNTQFGPGAGFKAGRRQEHEVLDDPAWNATPFLKQLKDKAYGQLGTSGGGNHFVEWGELRNRGIMANQAGQIAILSHSGSRRVGFDICNRYAKIAKQEHPELPKYAQELAWLELDSEAGMEYMVSMELAGKFARANHEVIHRRLAEAVGWEPTMVIDHHHNYAWREEHNGQEVIVHRKGATPAAEGELGVIPGDSIRPGFVVEGKGVKDSLDSASHGAGRRMSRKKAKENLKKEDWEEQKRIHDITMIGGGLDEAPLAYKDIRQVIKYQDDLVNVLGTFNPKIIRMDAGKNGGRYKKQERVTREEVPE